MLQVILVFVCGGIGSVCRYLLGSAVLAGVRDGWFKGETPLFPFGTVLINVTGSFLISVVMTISLNSKMISPDLRLALVTGFMGGFTTYSAFNYESVSLFARGNTIEGVANILVTVFVCLIAGWAGMALGRVIASAS